MPKDLPQQSKGENPFGELIGLNFSKSESGFSLCVLEVNEKLLNPFGYLHGGVVYSMADTGMGGALYSCLSEDERCATVEIKIIYIKGVTSGSLKCESKVIHKGNRFATMESEIRNDEQLIAKALGTFAIFEVRGD